MSSIPKATRFITLFALLFISTISIAGHHKTLHGLPVSNASDSELVQLRAGFAALDNGEQMAARKIFNQLVKNNNKLVMAYIGKMNVANSAEEFVMSVNNALAITKMNDAEKMLVEFNHSFIEGDAERRLALSEKLVTAYPKSFRAWFVRANTLAGQNMTKEARIAFNKTIEVAPSMTSAYLFTANNYMFSEPKDFDKAEAIMMQATEYAPSSALVYINLGDVYRAKTDLQNALLNYELASYLSPDMPTVHTKKGHANTFLGNYEEARANYAKATELSADDDPIISGNYYAFTYLYDGKPDKAHTELNNYLAEIDNQNIDESTKRRGKIQTLGNMAMIALHNYMSDEAEKDIDKLGKLIDEQSGIVNEANFTRSQNAYMAYMRGFNEVQAGNLDKAKALAKTMWDEMEPMKDDTKHEQYHLLMGQIAVKEGDNKEALRHLNLANENDVYTKYYKALAYQAMNNTEQSTKLFEELKDYNFNQIDFALIRNQAKEKAGS